MDFPVFLCAQLSTSILISPPLASAKIILLFFHDQLKVQFECLLVSWPLLCQNKIKRQISNPTENIVWFFIMWSVLSNERPKKLFGGLWIYKYKIFTLYQNQNYNHEQNKLMVPPPLTPNQGLKRVHFGLCLASPLNFFFFGREGCVSVPFHSVQDCSPGWLILISCLDQKVWWHNV